MTIRVTVRCVHTPGYNVQEDVFDIEHNSQVTVHEGVIYIRAAGFGQKPLAFYPKENVQRVWFDYPKPEMPAMQAGEEEQP